MRDNHIVTTDRMVPNGMLASPHIQYLIDKYEIIGGYIEKHLEAASYNMRIGGPVLTWYGGDRLEFTLGETIDANKNICNSVDLKPNSLTFVTTIERFQLPRDIIARFNLKSKWVHHGLLLGTGPIVDPQLHGHLLIPVHNFSNQTVTMAYGDEFISVEFTKILDPDPNTLLFNNKRYYYKDNEHWNLDYDKYKDRIINRTVESSVQSQFLESEKVLRQSKDTTERTRRDVEDTIKSVKEASEQTLRKFRNWSIISIVGALIGFIALFCTTIQIVYSNYEKADKAYNLVTLYDGTIANGRSLRSEIEMLQSEFKGLGQDIQRINNDSNEQSAKNAKTLSDIRSRLSLMDKQIRTLQGAEKIESKGNRK